MKKLIIKISIFLGMATVLLFLWGMLMEKYENPAIKRLDNELRALPKAHFLSFGNSQGMPLKIGAPNEKDVADLCMEGNDMIVVYDQMRTIEKEFNKGKTIFVNVSQLSFNMVGDTSDQEVRFNMQQFYSKLPWKYVTFRTAYPVMKYKVMAVNSMLSLDEALHPINPFTKSNYYPDLTNHANRHLALINGSKRLIPNIEDSIRHNIMRMKAMADAHGSRIVFYSFPCYYTYNQEFGDNNFDSLKNTIDQYFISNKLEYYDFFTDPEFTKDHSYFKDDIHLNERGAKIMVAKLFGKVFPAKKL